MTPSGSSFYAFHGPKEIWNYWDLPNPRLPYNLEFVFVDKLGTGNYVLERSVRLGDAGPAQIDINAMHYQFDYMEIMAEAMRNPFEGLDKLKGIITTQITYDRIPIGYDLFHLKGSEKKTYTPLALEVPYSALTQKQIENEYHFSLNLLINVSNKLGQIIYERSKDINFKNTTAELESLKDKTYHFQTSLSLEPETYKLHLLVLDNFSGKIGTLHQDFSVPKFSSEEISMSDIVLLSEKKTEKKETRLPEEKILAKVSHAFRSDEQLNVYFEVYNLSLDPKTGMNDFRTEYSFLHIGKLLTHVPFHVKEPTPERDCRVEISFKLKNFKPGEYILQVKVEDSNSGNEVSKETQFIVTQ